MKDTKETILLTALRLFAEKGYEAVSVSDIAEKLGLSKGALYRHYPGKYAIFESILKRMEQRDAEQALKHDLPAETAEESEKAYRAAKPEDMVAFAKSMFRYWTEDEFASRFRRMLTLEQYRSEEMGRLYQQYLVSGPLGYMTELFAAQGICDAGREAALFYGPMFLLFGVYDGAEDRAGVYAALEELMEHAERRLKEKTEGKHG